MKFSVRLSHLSVLFLFSLSAYGQIAGPNVNMVSGTQWPGGDPFLQRQNEPSMAISSRNPLHMLAGANDYRTVDLPGVAGGSEPTGDAWLGLFKSFDGGQTWTSTLVPGYPQDTSIQARFSPIKGLGAGADPSVRAGTNGMLYYSGLAFNRQAGGASKVFVASYTDDNNLEGGDSIRYLWTTAVKTSSSTTFEDKPTLAVDVPRSWSGFCIVPTLPLQDTQFFRAGTVYVAWTEFTGDPDTGPANIMFSRSIDCGLTWTPVQKISGSATINQGASLAIDPNTGTLYVAWRVFATSKPAQSDAIMYTASFDGGSTFSKPALITNISPFDQGDTGVSFRTNAYPALAVDAASHVYMAWSQRGAATPCGACGDARIEVMTGLPGTPPHNNTVTWSAPVAVDPWGSRGHQIMPALAFSAGKLTVAWYDLRDDDQIESYAAQPGGQYLASLVSDGGTPVFGPYIQDPVPPYTTQSRRQTLDVRAAQALPGDPPSFFPSIQVSQYAFGAITADQTVLQQLEVNAPNLPMFQTGTLPFIGDYIDIAGPTFIANHDGTWRFNNKPTDPDFTHVVWADNRNVIAPADGNWANYTPPGSATATTSLYDPTQQRPGCVPTTAGNTGDRNQDIYTAQLSPGLTVSARGNAKPLGTASNGSLMQREFPITVQNTTALTRYYQLTIGAQPTGGVASFLQAAVTGLPYPFTQIEVQVPALSSVSRSIFVTSTDAHATVAVSVVEVAGLNGGIVSGGQTGAVTINSDISNPNISNPNISNVEIYNPNISNPNISNPNISNPNISNPNISNPNISNPNISNVTIANPNISNPNISNPNISNVTVANPNISNPNISNPNISNAALSDSTWTVTNAGNTATAYSVKMLTGQTVPAGVSVQLVISQSYNSPSAIGCTPAVEQHFVPVASYSPNDPNTLFYSPGSLTNPAANDPTVPALSLLPGETAFVTLRVLDSTTNDHTQALQHFNPATATVPAIISHGSNTGSNAPPPIALVIIPVSLPPATVTAAYSQQLAAAGGTSTYTWVGTGVPAGLQLSAAGLLSGIPTAPGSFTFTVTVTSGTQTKSAQVTLLVNPAPLITTAALNPGDQSLAYSQQLASSGGTAPITWSAVQASLPAGLSLSATGLLSGNPAAGSYSPSITITDANGAIATKVYSLPIGTKPGVNPTSIAIGEQGAPYRQPLTATGGTGSLTFTPVTVDGVVLNSAGLFSGIPTAAGNFPFTATVTDSLGASSGRSLTLNVDTTLVLAAATLPAGAQNFVYPSQQLSVAGGALPYGSLTVTAGALPTGLSLSATGLISGTPTAIGLFPFTVSVTDSLGITAQQNYSITVNGLSVLGNASVNSGTLQLTSGRMQQSAVWLGAQQAVGGGFSATFQFQITTAPGAPYIADGFAFVIQNDSTFKASTIPSAGGGYLGYTGYSNSLAVEFDTYPNITDLGDPNGNHIAIMSNGAAPNSANHSTNSLSVTNSTPGFTLADGNPHSVTITYGGPGTVLTVYVDGIPVVSTATTTNMANYISGTAWVGFTAASGDGGEVTNVSNVTFSPK